MKARTIDGAFWRCKNIFFWRWNTLEHFWNQGWCMVHSDAIWNDVLEVGTAETMIKAKTQNWCIVALFETNVRRLEQLRTFWSQGRCMVHSDTIRNDVLEFGTAEKILKAKMQNCAFWCYLKRCFGSWNCLENVDLVAFFITSNIRFLNTPVHL